MLTKFPGVLLLILSLLKVILSQSSDIYIPETTNGELCVIPFIYKNTLFHDCIPDGASKPWCYTDQALTKWDYCKPHPSEFKNCKLANPNITIAEIKEILDEHNAFRSTLPALRMRKMSWNTELAQKAQAAAEKCKHDHVEVSLCGDRESVGQNLFYSYHEDGYPDLLSWKNIILNWSGEKKNFDISGNRCQAGKLCGHFTQVAWDHSYLIGCGKAACHGPIKNKVAYSLLYYCNYYQAGNQGDERPFIESTSVKCKDCHLFDSTKKFRCDEDRLCETCDKSEFDTCVGIDDVKKMFSNGYICADTDVHCASNSQFCDAFREGIDLPSEVSEYMKKCKKTCKMCS